MKTKIILGTFMLLTFWSNAQTTDPALKEVKKLSKPATKLFQILRIRTMVLYLQGTQKMLVCFLQMQSRNAEGSKLILFQRRTSSAR